MNKVVWFEIPFDESDRAQKFYKDVFGWQMNPFPEMDYYVVTTADSDPQTMEPKTPDAINGGLMKKDDTAKHPLVLIEVPQKHQLLELNITATNMWKGIATATLSEIDEIQLNPLPPDLVHFLFDIVVFDWIIILLVLILVVCFIYRIVKSYSKTD